MRIYRIAIGCLLLVVLLCCMPGAQASEVTKYDMDALQEYCDKWGVYYQQTGVRLLFSLNTLPGKLIYQVTCSSDYKSHESTVSDVLSQWRSAGTLYLAGTLSDDGESYSIGFSYSSFDKSERPESLTLYSDDCVYPFRPSSVNDDSWKTFYFDDAISLSLMYALLGDDEAATLEIASYQGTSKIKLTKENPEKLSLMLGHLLKGINFCRDNNSSQYRNASMLPPVAMPTATPKPTPTPKPTATPQYAFGNVPYVASLGTSISSLILKKGEYDASGAVYAIQSRLYQMGYLDADEVDGYYDDEIIEAIREFRDKNKLTDEFYDISIFLIDDKTLSKLYDDNAKKGDLYKATDADRSATDSGSSSSQSGSSSKGGHWEWQWQWVWRYLTCFNTSRDCPKCRGLGSYQDLVQEKIPVWVPD